MKRWTMEAQNLGIDWRKKIFERLELQIRIQRLQSFLYERLKKGHRFSIRPDTHTEPAAPPKVYVPLLDIIVHATPLQVKKHQVQPRIASLRPFPNKIAESGGFSRSQRSRLW